MAEIQEFKEYAIFQSGGKQYQAIEGKTISLEKLEGEAGDKVEFDEVFFRKTDDGKMEIGQPTLKGSVKASIIKHMRDPKIVVFNFRRRKKSRVKKGHRQSKTIVRIESIA